MPKFGPGATCGVDLMCDPVLLNAPLLLLRHGETVWNTQRRIQGHKDSPLTELGQAQAAAQGRVLDGLELSGWALRASPLGRAQQTAQLAWPGGAWACDTDLAEIGAGDYEGRAVPEIAAEVPGFDALGDLDRFASAPNGEGFDAFRDRVTRVVQNCAGPSVLVTHGLFLSVLRGLVGGMSRRQMNALDRPQGVVIRLDPDGTETVLRP